MGIETGRVSGRNLGRRPPANRYELSHVRDQRLSSGAGEKEPEAHVRVPVLRWSIGFGNGDEARLGWVRCKDSVDSQLFTCFTFDCLNWVFARVHVPASREPQAGLAVVNQQD